jgi:hypothetical protein
LNSISAEALGDYWSAPQIAANAVIFCNLLGALLLGFVVGYERTYHGRPRSRHAKRPASTVRRPNPTSRLPKSNG